MDKGILKMVAIVTIISIMLLVGSICLAVRYGGLMLQQSINTSDQTNQDNGTGASNSSSPSNQKSMSPQK